MEIEHLSHEELIKSLTYKGFILIIFELTKNLIMEPIKVFF